MRQRSSRMEDTCIEYFNILVARMIQQHFCGQMDFPIQWFGLSLHLYIYKYHNPGSSSKIFTGIIKTLWQMSVTVCNILEGCILCWTTMISLIWPVKLIQIYSLLNNWIVCQPLREHRMPNISAVIIFGNLTPLQSRLQNQQNIPSINI